MIDYIKSFFNKSEIDNEVSLNFDGEIKFILKIGNLNIGNLYVENELWKFAYTEEFKEQIALMAKSVKNAELYLPNIRAPIGYKILLQLPQHPNLSKLIQIRQQQQKT